MNQQYLSLGHGSLTVDCMYGRGCAAMIIYYLAFSLLVSNAFIFPETSSRIPMLAMTPNTETSYFVNL